MKQIYITLVTLFLTGTLFAQGIAVQGIARDNNKAALPQKVLNFTFKIVSEGDVQRYTEDASIRTDNFGVFSHIVGTGDKLDNVDFSEQGLQIEVSILYPTKVVVYKEGFNYTPYAHYAANGVPTGSIMPYMGETAPAGWLLCDGRDIPSQYTDLRAMFSNNKTPNLQGRFLKGAGFNSSENNLDRFTFDETTLGEYQTQSLQNHKHNQGSLKTNNDGAHGHKSVTNNLIGGGLARSRVFSDSAFKEVVTDGGESLITTKVDSNAREKFLIGFSGSEHEHSIIGETSGVLGGSVVKTTTEETKPNNFSVNYIIKL